MRDLSFTTFQEITRVSKSKKVVLFGAGVISEKTVRSLKEKYHFILDNNPNLWDTQQLNTSVLNPKILLQNGHEEYFVIICTTSFNEVIEQLEGMGLKAGVDFVVSPILNDLRVISELENCTTKLLFTSGFPEDEDPRWGGGMYELQLNGLEWEYQKVYSGICYGIIKFDGNYIVIDDNKGLVELDKDYNIIRNTELQPGTRAHGVAYSKEKEFFYVAASYRDCVLIFDKELKPMGSIPLSNKYEQTGTPSHHCNDVCVVGNSLYVSMFSQTGNFKKDIFDGVVLEIDINSKEILGPVISDLWMPHNVSFYNGSLTVCDSLRGLLKKNNAQAVGQFPGFTRGLDTDGIYYYVGQSRNRNYSKYLGLSLNISIDTSIIIFDEHTKVSRSIQFPSKLSEIHSILLIN
jgi:hypothetical protein